MGRRTRFDYDEQMRSRKRNIGNVIINQQGITTKNRPKEYKDVLLFSFSTGLDLRLVTSPVSTQPTQQLLLNLPQNSNYFPTMDSILQFASKDILQVRDQYITSYYGLPLNTVIYVFSGTVFNSSELNGLAAMNPRPYILIPSTYPIFFDGISYQVFVSTPPVPINSTLRIGTSPVQIKTTNQTYTIGSNTFTFIVGGSPGLSQVGLCPTIDELNGGENNNVVTREVDGGLVDVANSCFINAGVIA